MRPPHLLRLRSSRLYSGQLPVCPSLGVIHRGQSPKQRLAEEKGRALSPSQVFCELTSHGRTVKVPELVAVPPGVVIAILPVFAPVGTVAVTFESEFTVKAVALTPPNVTLDACVRPLPVITARTQCARVWWPSQKITAGYGSRRNENVGRTLLSAAFDLGVDVDFPR
jgi:hypothetical protein